MEIIMKKLNKIFAMSIAAILCTANFAFAATEVPRKVDPDDSGSKTTASATKKEDSDDATSKPSASAKASAKAKESASAKASAKASEKATEKAKSKETEKPTEKAKATEKATAKATSKSEKDDDEEKESDSDKVVLGVTDEEDVLVIETTEEPSINIQGNAAQLENDKYLTNVGGFLWFLFGVIVSAVISFAISYRFFMMLKRDNHINAEIRALKRDIDSKMVGTVTGFSEYDINMSNSNPSYAKEDSPIRTTRTYETDEKSEEIYKKWENQLNTGRDVKKPEKFTTSPITRTAPSDSEPRRTTYERRRPSKKKDSGLSGKIKGVFNDMFPFDK